MAAEEIIPIKVTTDTAQATQDVQKLDKAFEETEQSVKGLRTQLREAVANVTLMSDKFGATSKEAINAAKRAAELKDRIGDAKALTDAFNPDAKFKAVASSLAGVAGGFSALQGGMALFGKENKDVEQALLKVNAAMALSQGLQSVGESIDSFRQLGAVIKSTTVFQELNNAATKTAAVVQRAFGVATVETSTGFKVLKGAIVATGIGALVVLLGSVIANFDAISDWIKKSPLGSLAKGVGALVEQFTDFIGVTSEAERNLNKLSAANKRANEDINNRIKVLKAQGGSEKEIYELSQQRVNNELNILRQSLKTKGKLTEEEYKQFSDLKTEQLVLTAEYNKKTADASAKAAEKAQKDRDDANKKAADQAQKDRDEAKKKAEEDTKAANKMLIELQNAKSLALIEDENAKAAKQLEIDKKAKEDEIKQLTVAQSVKDELIKLNNDKFVADKNALDKKIKEDQDKKNKEDQDSLDAFNEKIKEIKIAAIDDEVARAKEERLAKLDKDTKELEEDKNFLKLSETEKTELRNQLKQTAEDDITDIELESEKKRLDTKLRLLELNSAALIKGTESYFDNREEIIKESEKKELLDLQDQFNQRKISEEEFQKQTAAIQGKYAAQLKQSNKEKLDTYLGYATSVLSAVNNIFSAASALNKAKMEQDLKNVKGNAVEEEKIRKKYFEQNKKTQIAQAIIGTLQSAVQAYQSLAVIPIVGPFLGAAAAAAALVFGYKQVAMIKAQNYESAAEGTTTAPDTGSGGGIPSTGGGGGGAAIPDTGGGGAPNTGGGGGGSTGGGGGGGGTVRAYVIQSDIEDAQSRENEIQNRARFE
jgi:myosin heavy subunit